MTPFRRLRSGSLIAAALLLLGVAARSSAYEISQVAKNRNSLAAPPSALQNGQTLTLYGGQTILSTTSTSAAFNTFPTRSSVLVSGGTQIRYSGASVAVDAVGGMYVRTASSSVLLKSWNWTKNGTAQYPASAVSGSVSASSSSASKFADSEVTQGGTADQTVDWTFYNGSAYPVFLPNPVFRFESSEELPAESRLVSLFGGARRDTEEQFALPPRGGVIFRVRPVTPQQVQPRQVRAIGLASMNGMETDVGFIHRTPFPGCIPGTRRLTPSSKWNAYILNYLRAQQGRRTAKKLSTVARGDMLVGPAQLWFNELAVRTGFQPQGVVALLRPRPSSGSLARRARAELAALLMTRAKGVVRPKDIVTAYGANLETVLDRVGRQIASGKTVEVRRALKTLIKINNGTVTCGGND